MKITRDCEFNPHCCDLTKNFRSRKHNLWITWFDDFFSSKSFESYRCVSLWRINELKVFFGDKFSSIEQISTYFFTISMFGSTSNNYLFVFSRDLDTFSKKHLEQSNGVNPAANKGELCFDIPSEYANIFFLSENIL